MITVQEAKQIISKNTVDYGTEKLTIDACVGKILREDLLADRDFPPYDRVTMDGIAILYERFQNGNRVFPIEGMAAAGTPQQTLQNPDGCLEVMTGSILPLNTDVVIRYEDLKISEGQAELEITAISNRQNVHGKGEDRKMSDTLIEPGVKIGSPEIGVCATIGKTELLVSKMPKAIIISTGDELVEVHETPEAHQIRKSNVHHLRATLNQYGLSADIAHLNDNLEEIKIQLKDILENYEVIILSGGVSMGKFDFLPQALTELGVKKLFHKILQRPGKPFWFGSYGAKSKIFALPGNPVSSFLCVQAYFLPWLSKSLKMNEQEEPKARLMSYIHFKPDLTYYLQVKISYGKDGALLATAVEGHGSGDLANLVDADAFLQLPQGKDVFGKGDVYPVLFFR